MPPKNILLESQSRAVKTHKIAYSLKNLGQKFCPLDWRPGPGKVGHKNAKTPHLWRHFKRTPIPKLKKNFLTRN